MNGDLEGTRVEKRMIREKGRPQAVESRIRSFGLSAEPDGEKRRIGDVPPPHHSDRADSR